MPKNFKKLPALAESKIVDIAGDAVEVRSTKTLKIDELVNLDQLDISADQVTVGSRWLLEPSSLIGKTSAKNAAGWAVTRKDLPKYTKSFCHDTPNFGDPSRGWSTTCRDMEVYHKDIFLPRNHQIVVTVEEELPDGRFGVKFTLTDQFNKNDANFHSDLLLGFNLVQENFGNAEVSEPDAPQQFFTEVLDWELFPPGNIETVVGSLTAAGRLKGPNEVEIARARLQLFEKYKPINYIRGLSGNDSYIGAKYADDLVVFESTKYGNAMYLLYIDWEELSARPRSELLQLSGNEVDRIVHRGAWENEFKGLLRRKLRARGRSISAR